MVMYKAAQKLQEINILLIVVFFYQSSFPKMSETEKTRSKGNKKTQTFKDGQKNLTH